MTDLDNLAAPQQCASKLAIAFGLHKISARNACANPVAATPHLVSPLRGEGLLLPIEEQSGERAKG